MVGYIAKLTEHWYLQCHWTKDFEVFHCTIQYIELPLDNLPLTSGAL